MKKITIFLSIFLLCMTTFSFATTEDAVVATDETTDDIILDMQEDDLEDIIQEEISSQVVEDKNTYDDVYEMDEDVDLEGMIDANVYQMGKTVKIKNATIYGNVYVMAEKIDIENTQITGSIYAMAETINFSGEAKDAYFLAETINFSEDTEIIRNVKMAGKTVNLNGSFSRNVLVSCAELNIAETVFVNGKLKCDSKNSVEVPAGAIINEKGFTQIEIEEDDVKIEQGLKVSSIIKKFLTIAVKTAVMSLIIVACITKFSKLNRTEKIANDLLKASGIGFLNLILIPVVAIMLLITVVGVGLSFILIMLYIIAIYFSTSITSVEIAQRILLKQNSEITKGKFVGASVLVSIIICAIGYIPVIGGLVKFASLIIGLGILFNLVFQKEKKEEIINEN